MAFKKSGLVCMGLVLCVIIQTSEQVKEGALIPCSRSDPKISDCFKEASPILLKSLTKSFPEYNWRSMDPTILDFIESKAGGGSVGLGFKMEDTKMSGLSKCRQTKLKVDMKLLDLKVTLFCPREDVVTNYEMKGKIIILPIFGKGKAHVTLDNTHLDVHIKAEMVNINGTERLKAKLYTCKIRPGKTHFHFENLFNGDKFLGSQMNRFMNDNDAEVVKMFLPAVEKRLGEQGMEDFNNLMEAVSYDDLLLD